MLGKLLTEKRIQTTKQVLHWEEAISLAAKPLLDDGSIEESYVQAMIAAAHRFGPYMVLADRFALPHAQGEAGVNRLAMSLLIVEDEVDMLGELVNMFMVLATPDANAHIEVLASLSEILREPENLRIMQTGECNAILALME